MAFKLDTATGDITCRRGDHGKLYLYGIPTDKDYTLYFAARDSKGVIFYETSTIPDESGEALFFFSPSVTDKWEVPGGAKSKVYYWAVKLSYEPEDFEETLIIGKNKTMASANRLIVYPKTVEGPNNG